MIQGVVKQETLPSAQTDSDQAPTLQLHCIATTTGAARAGGKVLHVNGRQPL